MATRELILLLRYQRSSTLYPNET